MKALAGFPTTAVQWAANTAQVSHIWEPTQVLTEELGGACTGGLLVVSEAFVDDLPHGGIEALQLLVLGGHA